MSRWYQHVLSGKQVEVKTLEEDDKYVGESVWARIATPPGKEDKPAAKKTAAKSA